MADRRCKCSHYTVLHNKHKNEYHPDGRWKAQYSDGCRAANCRCLTFREKKVKQNG